MISKIFLRVSVVMGQIGIILGLVMGIRQDFTLAPAHAHLNLVGFVVMFLAGLYYQAVPQASASVLAKYHAVIAIVGAIVFPVGIAMVSLGGSAVLVKSGSVIVLIGASLFAIIVFRSTRPGPTIAMQSATNPERAAVRPAQFNPEI
jgi:peptidoglycan/LPS O-acetylase OafA/YrhL